jgi:hypothetical protein
MVPYARISFQPQWNFLTHARLAFIKVLRDDVEKL